MNDVNIVVIVPHRNKRRSGEEESTAIQGHGKEEQRVTRVRKRETIPGR